MRSSLRSRSNTFSAKSFEPPSPSSASIQLMKSYLAFILPPPRRETPQVSSRCWPRHLVLEEHDLVVGRDGDKGQLQRGLDVLLLALGVVPVEMRLKLEVVAQHQSSLPTRRATRRRRPPRGSSPCSCRTPSAPRAAGRRHSGPS